MGRNPIGIGNIRVQKPGGNRDTPINIDKLDVIDLDEEPEEHEVVEVLSEDDPIEAILINSDDESDDQESLIEGQTVRLVGTNAYSSDDDLDLILNESEDEGNYDDAWFYWSIPVLKTFSNMLISVCSKYLDDTRRRLTWDGCYFVKENIIKHHPHEVTFDALTDDCIGLNLDRLHSYYVAYLTLLDCPKTNYNRRLGSFEPVEGYVLDDEFVESTRVYLKKNGVVTEIINPVYLFNQRMSFLEELHYFFKEEDWADRAPAAARSFRRRFRIPSTRND